MRLVTKRMKESGHLTKLEISCLMDGELRPEDAKSARRHLNKCAKCCARGRRFKKADALLRAAKEKRGH